MWLKAHPWVFPIIIGCIGIMYLMINNHAIAMMKKLKKKGINRFISGIPFLGGIHLFIAGIISPCKWLALLFVLDYTIWYFLYAFFIGDRINEGRHDKNKD
ncbi:MAG: hypothetical protein K6F17_06625 [Lachnospiraceae bacterium]|nr:hypothetical protein [Lachnospiraceae bacterium]